MLPPETAVGGGEIPIGDNGDPQGDPAAPQGAPAGLAPAAAQSAGGAGTAAGNATGAGVTTDTGNATRCGDASRRISTWRTGEIDRASWKMGLAGAGPGTEEPPLPTTKACEMAGSCCLLHGDTVPVAAAMACA